MPTIQESIELVSGYHPTESSPADEAVMAAVQHLKTALGNVSQIADGIRPVLKTLVRAAVLIPGEWSSVLQSLRDALDCPDLPWLHRAFLLKLLPEMLNDGSDAPRNCVEVCELLLRWATPSGETEDGRDGTQCSGTQEQRVALTALFSLPEAYFATIVQCCVSRLPPSLPMCLSLLTNQHAPNPLKLAFERWIVEAEASSLHGDCVAVIKKTLQEKYSGFGSLFCKDACAALIASEGLKCMEDLNTFLPRLEAVHAFDNSHHEVIGGNVPLTFVVAKVAELLDIISTQRPDSGGWTQVKMSEEDSVLFLSVLRSLVRLGCMTVDVPGSISVTELQRVCAPVLAISDDDTSLDTPLHLVECIFYIMLRALPCVSMEDADVGATLGRIVAAVDVFLPVVDDAIVRIRSYGFHHEPKVPSDGCRSGALTEEEERRGRAQPPLMSDEQRRRALEALCVARVVARLCHGFTLRYQRWAANPLDAGRLKSMIDEMAPAARLVVPSWCIAGSRLSRYAVPDPSGSLWRKPLAPGARGNSPIRHDSHRNFSTYAFPPRPRRRGLGGAFREPTKRPRW